MMTQRNAMMTRGRRSTIRHERQRPAGADDNDDTAATLSYMDGMSGGNDPLVMMLIMMSMPMMPMQLMTERQRPAGDDDDNDVDGDYGDDPLYIMSDNDSLLKVTITMMIVMTRGQRSTIRHERQRPAGDDDDDTATTICCMARTATMMTERRRPDVRTATTRYMASHF